MKNVDLTDEMLTSGPNFLNMHQGDVSDRDGIEDSATGTSPRKSVGSIECISDEEVSGKRLEMAVQHVERPANVDCLTASPPCTPRSWSSVTTGAVGTENSTSLQKRNGFNMPSKDLSVGNGLLNKSSTVHQSIDMSLCDNSKPVNRFAGPEMNESAYFPFGSVGKSLRASDLAESLRSSAPPPGQGSALETPGDTKATSKAAKDQGNANERIKIAHLQVLLGAREAALAHEHGLREKIQHEWDEVKYTLQQQQLELEQRLEMQPKSDAFVGGISVERLEQQQIVQRLQRSLHQREQQLRSVSEALDCFRVQSHVAAAVLQKRLQQCFEEIDKANTEKSSRDQQFEAQQQELRLLRQQNQLFEQQRKQAMDGFGRLQPVVMKQEELVVALRQKLLTSNEECQKLELKVQQQDAAFFVLQQQNIDLQEVVADLRRSIAGNVRTPGSHMAEGIDALLQLERENAEAVANERIEKLGRQIERQDLIIKQQQQRLISAQEAEKRVQFLDLEIQQKDIQQQQQQQQQCQEQEQRELLLQNECDNLLSALESLKKQHDVQLQDQIMRDHWHQQQLQVQQDEILRIQKQLREVSEKREVLETTVKEQNQKLLEFKQQKEQTAEPGMHDERVDGINGPNDNIRLAEVQEQVEMVNAEEAALQVRCDELEVTKGKISCNLEDLVDLVFIGNQLHQKYLKNVTNRSTEEITQEMGVIFAKMNDLFEIKKTHDSRKSGNSMTLCQEQQESGGVTFLVDKAAFNENTCSNPVADSSPVNRKSVSVAGSSMWSSDNSSDVLLRGRQVVTLLKLDEQLKRRSVLAAQAAELEAYQNSCPNPMEKRASLTRVIEKCVQTDPDEGPPSSAANDNQQLMQQQQELRQLEIKNRLLQQDLDCESKQVQLLHEQAKSTANDLKQLQAELAAAKIENIELQFKVEDMVKQTVRLQQQVKEEHEKCNFKVRDTEQIKQKLEALQREHKNVLQARVSVVDVAVQTKRIANEKIFVSTSTQTGVRKKGLKCIEFGCQTNIKTFLEEIKPSAIVVAKACINAFAQTCNIDVASCGIQTEFEEQTHGNILKMMESSTQTCDGLSDASTATKSKSEACVQTDILLNELLIDSASGTTRTVLSTQDQRSDTGSGRSSSTGSNRGMYKKMNSCCGKRSCSCFDRCRRRSSCTVQKCSFTRQRRDIYTSEKRDVCTKNRRDSCVVERRRSCASHESMGRNSRTAILLPHALDKNRRSAGLWKKSLYQPGGSDEKTQDRPVEELVSLLKEADGITDPAPPSRDAYFFARKQRWMTHAKQNQRDDFGFGFSHIETHGTSRFSQVNKHSSLSTNYVTNANERKSSDKKCREALLNGYSDRRGARDYVNAVSTERTFSGFRLVCTQCSGGFMCMRCASAGDSISGCWGFFYNEEFPHKTLHWRICRCPKNVHTSFIRVAYDISTDILDTGIEMSRAEYSQSCLLVGRRGVNGCKNNSLTLFSTANKEEEKKNVAVAVAANHALSILKQCKSLLQEVKGTLKNSLEPPSEQFIDLVRTQLAAVLWGGRDVCLKLKGSTDQLFSEWVLHMLWRWSSYLKPVFDGPVNVSQNKREKNENEFDANKGALKAYASLNISTLSDVHLELVKLMCNKSVCAGAAEFEEFICTLVYALSNVYLGVHNEHKGLICGIISEGNTKGDVLEGMGSKTKVQQDILPLLKEFTAKLQNKIDLWSFETIAKKYILGFSAENTEKGANVSLFEGMVKQQLLQQQQQHLPQQLAQKNHLQQQKHFEVVMREREEWIEQQVKQHMKDVVAQQRQQQQQQQELQRQFLEVMKMKFELLKKEKEIETAQLELNSQLAKGVKAHEHHSQDDIYRYSEKNSTGTPQTLRCQLEAQIEFKNVELEKQTQRSIALDAQIDQLTIALKAETQRRQELFQQLLDAQKTVCRLDAVERSNKNYQTELKDSLTQIEQLQQQLANVHQQQKQQHQQELQGVEVLKKENFDAKEAVEREISVMEAKKKELIRFKDTLESEKAQILEDKNEIRKKKDLIGREEQAMQEQLQQQQLQQQLQQQQLREKEEELQQQKRELQQERQELQHELRQKQQQFQQQKWELDQRQQELQQKQQELKQQHEELQKRQQELQQEQQQLQQQKHEMQFQHLELQKQLLDLKLQQQEVCEGKLKLEDGERNLRNQQQLLEEQSAAFEYETKSQMQKEKKLEQQKQEMQQQREELQQRRQELQQRQQELQQRHQELLQHERQLHETEGKLKKRYEEFNASCIHLERNKIEIGVGTEAFDTMQEDIRRLAEVVSMREVTPDETKEQLVVEVEAVEPQLQQLQKQKQPQQERALQQQKQQQRWKEDCEQKEMEFQEMQQQMQKWKCELEDKEMELQQQRNQLQCQEEQEEQLREQLKEIMRLLRECRKHEEIEVAKGGQSHIDLICSMRSKHEAEIKLLHRSAQQLQQQEIALCEKQNQLEAFEEGVRSREEAMLLQQQQLEQTLHLQQQMVEVDGIRCISAAPPFSLDDGNRETIDLQDKIESGLKRHAHVDLRTEVGVQTEVGMNGHWRERGEDVSEIMSNSTDTEFQQSRSLSRFGHREALFQARYMQEQIEALRIQLQHLQNRSDSDGEVDLAQNDKRQQKAYVHVGTYNLESSDPFSQDSILKQQNPCIDPRDSTVEVEVADSNMPQNNALCSSGQHYSLTDTMNCSGDEIEVSSLEKQRQQQKNQVVVGECGSLAIEAESVKMGVLTLNGGLMEEQEDLTYHGRCIEMERTELEKLRHELSQEARKQQERLLALQQQEGVLLKKEVHLEAAKQRQKQLAHDLALQRKLLLDVQQQLEEDKHQLRKDLGEDNTCNVFRGEENDASYIPSSDTRIQNVFDFLLLTFKGYAQFFHSNMNSSFCSQYNSSSSSSNSLMNASSASMTCPLPPKVDIRSILESDNNSTDTYRGEEKDPILTSTIPEKYIYNKIFNSSHKYLSRSLSFFPALTFSDLTSLELIVVKLHRLLQMVAANTRLWLRDRDTRAKVARVFFACKDHTNNLHRNVEECKFNMPLNFGKTKICPNNSFICPDGLHINTKTMNAKISADELVQINDACLLSQQKYLNESTDYMHHCGGYEKNDAYTTSSLSRKLQNFEPQTSKQKARKSHPRFDTEACLDADENTPVVPAGSTNKSTESFLSGFGRDYLEPADIHVRQGENGEKKDEQGNGCDVNVRRVHVKQRSFSLLSRVCEISKPIKSDPSAQQAGVRCAHICATNSPTSPSVLDDEKKNVESEKMCNNILFSLCHEEKEGSAYFKKQTLTLPSLHSSSSSDNSEDDGICVKGGFEHGGKFGNTRAHKAEGYISKESDSRDKIAILAAQADNAAAVVRAYSPRSLLQEYENELCSEVEQRDLTQQKCHNHPQASNPHHICKPTEQTYELQPQVFDVEQEICTSEQDLNDDTNGKRYSSLNKLPRLLRRQICFNAKFNSFIDNSPVRETPSFPSDICNSCDSPMIGVDPWDYVESGSMHEQSSLPPSRGKIIPSGGRPYDRNDKSEVCGSSMASSNCSDRSNSNSSSTSSNNWSSSQDNTNSSIGNSCSNSNINSSNSNNTNSNSSTNFSSISRTNSKTSRGSGCVVPMKFIDEYSSFSGSVELQQSVSESFQDDSENTETSAVL